MSCHRYVPATLLPKKKTTKSPEQEVTGHFGEDKNYFPLPGIESSTPPSHYVGYAAAIPILDNNPAFTATRGVQKVKTGRVHRPRR